MLNDLEKLNRFTIRALDTFQPPARKPFIFVDICFSNIEDTAIVEQLKPLTKSTLSSTQGKKIHFGLACFANFGIAAKTKPDAILLFDKEWSVLYFNQLAIKILKESNIAKEFKTKLVKKVKENDNLKEFQFYPKKQKAKTGDINEILEIEYSFCNNEEDFKFIKGLAHDGKIFLAQGDLLNQQDVNKVKKYIGKSGYEVTSAYISNIYGWVKVKNNTKKTQEEHNKLNNNFKSLFNEDTQIVSGSKEIKIQKLNKVINEDRTSSTFMKVVIGVCAVALMAVLAKFIYEVAQEYQIV